MRKEGKEKRKKKCLTAFRLDKKNVLNPNAIPPTVNHRRIVRVSISVHRLETGSIKEDKRGKEKKTKKKKKDLTRDVENQGAVS